MPKFEQHSNDMKDLMAESDAAYDKAIEEAKKRGDDKAVQQIQEARAKEWRPSAVDANAAAVRAQLD